MVNPSDFIIIERPKRDKGWRRSVISVPTIYASPFYISFEVVKKGYFQNKLIEFRLDNITLSKECFAIGK